MSEEVLEVIKGLSSATGIATSKFKLAMGILPLCHATTIIEARSVYFAAGENNDIKYAALRRMVELEMRARRQG